MASEGWFLSYKCNCYFFFQSIYTSFVEQVELKSGETYRGELAEAEDSWNVQLKQVTATAKVLTFVFYRRVPRRDDLEWLL